MSHSRSDDARVIRDAIREAEYLGTYGQSEAIDALTRLMAVVIAAEEVVRMSDALGRKSAGIENLRLLLSRDSGSPDDNAR